MVVSPTENFGASGSPMTPAGRPRSRELLWLEAAAVAGQEYSGFLPKHHSIAARGMDAVILEKRNLPEKEVL